MVRRRVMMQQQQQQLQQQQQQQLQQLRLAGGQLAEAYSPEWLWQLLQWQQQRPRHAGSMPHPPPPTPPAEGSSRRLQRLRRQLMFRHQQRQQQQQLQQQQPPSTAPAVTAQCSGATWRQSTVEKRLQAAAMRRQLLGDFSLQELNLWQRQQQQQCQQQLLQLQQLQQQQRLQQEKRQQEEQRQRQQQQRLEKKLLKQMQQQQQQQRQEQQAEQQQKQQQQQQLQQLRQQLQEQQQQRQEQAQQEHQQEQQDQQQQLQSQQQEQEQLQQLQELQKRLQQQQEQQEQQQQQQQQQQQEQQQQEQQQQQKLLQQQRKKQQQHRQQQQQEHHQLKQQQKQQHQQQPQQQQQLHQQLPQQQQQQQQTTPPSFLPFNFGTYANSFLNYNSDTESTLFSAANRIKEQPLQKLSTIIDNFNYIKLAQKMLEPGLLASEEKKLPQQQRRQQAQQQQPHQQQSQQQQQQHQQSQHLSNCSPHKLSQVELGKCSKSSSSSNSSSSSSSSSDPSSDTTLKQQQLPMQPFDHKLSLLATDIDLNLAAIRQLLEAQLPGKAVGEEMPQREKAGQQQLPVQGQQRPTKSKLKLARHDELPALAKLFQKKGQKVNETTSLLGSLLQLTSKSVQDSATDQGDGQQSRPNKFALYLMLSSDEESEGEQLQSGQKSCNIPLEPSDYVGDCGGKMCMLGQHIQQLACERKRRKRPREVEPHHTSPPRRPLHWPKVDYSLLQQQQQRKLGKKKKCRVLRRVITRHTHNWWPAQQQ